MEEQPVVNEPIDAIMEARDADETLETPRGDACEMQDIDDKEEKNCDKFIVEDLNEAKEDDENREEPEREDINDDDVSVATEVAGTPVVNVLSSVKEETASVLESASAEAQDDDETMQSKNDTSATADKVECALPVAQPTFCGFNSCFA